jgi:hypothetical protein
MRVLVGIVVVAAALLAATSAGGREAVQIVDRTVLCTLAPSYLAQGEKEFDFDAGPREFWPATSRHACSRVCTDGQAAGPREARGPFEPRLDRRGVRVEGGGLPRQTPTSGLA